VDSCCRSKQPRCPDLVEGIIDARKRESHGFNDQAPRRVPSLHAADHDLGPVHKACWDRYERLDHLLLRPHTAGEGGRGRHRQRGPIEGVLQDAGYAMIVFGRDHDHAIARLDGQGAQRFRCTRKKVLARSKAS
jgi:hypothetical protein